MHIHKTLEVLYGALNSKQCPRGASQAAEQSGQGCCLGTAEQEGTSFGSRL